MRYVPALDGIRALAVLAVLLMHCGVPYMQGGAIGVDVFFVLSGYLITQVLREHPDIPRFYLRRFLRLAPPLTLMLLAYVSLGHWINPAYPHWRDALVAFFYLSDYGVAFWNVPQYVAHTWSLAVEEHFYLLWPLVLLKLRPTLGALLLAYFVAIGWRWGLEFGIGHPWDTYFRFDTRLSGLILGCALAYGRRLGIPAWIGMAGLLIAIIRPNFSGYGWGIRAAQMAVDMLAAVVIAGAHPKWLGHAALAYVGRLSYGIYLWHFPISRYLIAQGWSWQGTTLITLFSATALAALSYHTVEAAFCKRRRSRPSEAVELVVAARTGA